MARDWRDRDRERGDDWMEDRRRRYGWDDEGRGEGRSNFARGRNRGSGEAYGRWREPWEGGGSYSSERSREYRGGRGTGGSSRGQEERGYGPSERQQPFEEGYGRSYGYSRGGGNEPEWAQEYGYGRAGQSGYGRRREDDERGFWDRASDEVSSWFGDSDAERRRDRDRRMDENYRGRGPKNYTRSDDRIREDVCDRLCDHPSIDASEMDVKVANAEVTLSGTVMSRDQRRRAEDCAEQVSGVRHVQNDLRVKDRGQTTGSDQGTVSNMFGSSATSDPGSRS